ncbi:MAG TPA: transglutaminase family protein [Chthoniobacterales bacterium]
MESAPPPQSGSPTRFHLSCHLEYNVAAPVALLCNFRARTTPFQTIQWEKVSIQPEMPAELVVTEPDQNRFDRLKISRNQTLALDYEAVVEASHQFLNPEQLRKVSPAHLDPAQLPFLLPSRYCQSDLLGRFAWQKFGQMTDSYDQVQAITQWIHENIEYVPGTTTSATSAYDTVTQCAGVCRDFAHLGIALCRALNTPARYFTGYAFQLNPPDFHACFEVFIGGSWLLFDATRLVPLNGLVSIGAGRDAADVSVCTVFGNARLLTQSVTSKVESPEFVPLQEAQFNEVAISLDARKS